MDKKTMRMHKILVAVIIIMAVLNAALLASIR